MCLGRRRRYSWQLLLDSSLHPWSLCHLYFFRVASSIELRRTLLARRVGVVVDPPLFMEETGVRVPVLARSINLENAFCCVSCLMDVCVVSACKQRYLPFPEPGLLPCINSVFLYLQWIVICKLAGVVWIQSGSGQGLGTYTRHQAAGRWVERRRLCPTVVVGFVLGRLG